MWQFFQAPPVFVQARVSQYCVVSGFPSLRRCWRTTQVVIALFFVSILTCLLVTVVRVLDASDKLKLWYSRSLTSTETAGSNDVTSFETYFLKISKFRDWIASCNESNARSTSRLSNFSSSTSLSPFDFGSDLISSLTSSELEFWFCEFESFDQWSSFGQPHDRYWL